MNKRDTLIGDAGTIIGSRVEKCDAPLTEFMMLKKKSEAQTGESAAYWQRCLDIFRSCSLIAELEKNLQGGGE